MYQGWISGLETVADKIDPVSGRTTFRDNLSLDDDTTSCRVFGKTIPFATVRLTSGILGKSIETVADQQGDYELKAGSFFKFNSIKEGAECTITVNGKEAWAGKLGDYNGPNEYNLL